MGSKVSVSSGTAYETPKEARINKPHRIANNFFISAFLLLLPEMVRI